MVLKISNKTIWKSTAYIANAINFLNISIQNLYTKIKFNVINQNVPEDTRKQKVISNQSSAEFRCNHISWLCVLDTAKGYVVLKSINTACQIQKEKSNT